MKKPWYLYHSIFCLTLVSLYVPTQTFAQNTDAQASEVYLDFRHRGAINSVVIAYYQNNEFFLPINELFELMQFDHTTQGLSISGKFASDEIPYSINFQSNKVRFGNRELSITVNDFLLTDLDFYITPTLFKKVFGLGFSVDFNTLTLQLETEVEIPIVQKILREQKRSRADDNRYERKNYDLKFDRYRPFLDGGFVDYNLSSTLNPQQNVYSFNTNVGLQLAGGDLQGSLYGSYSESFSNFNTSGLRWRYFIRDKPAITRLTVGQTRTDGIIQNPYTGIRISNEPIEPRYRFDELEVQGSTIPQSEVELYLNNLLIDYQQADALGNYRFLAPITYGASQFDVKIYGPTGQIIERSNRVQVPFNFQPSGVFNYTINAGELDNPLMGSTERNYTMQGSGAYGINDRMTLKTGIEYFEDLNSNKPTFTGALSTRIFSNYIVTLEGVSQAYYRGTMNVIYTNAASVNIDYTNFTNKVSMYNSSGDDKRIIGSLFYPFKVLNIPLNLRLSSYSRIRNAGSSTTFRVDGSSTFGRLNLRVGYSDRTAGAFDPFNPSTTSALDASATYTITNNPNLPSILRGTFIRSSMRYMVQESQIESADLLVSRNVFKQGKAQISYGRNFKQGFNSLRFNLIIDFNKVRSSSTFSNIRDNSNFTQNIRGSVGYDTNYNNLLFTSRDQVGRAGAAVKLFVDNDNDGMFDPKKDDSITENALRIDRSGASSIVKNGILYFSQMQPYYFYNMELNKGALKNPMLVPEIEKFGVITDPNRYKKIEIPFYMSGVIEGKVERLYADDQKSGIGGLKLTLENIKSEYSTELRTFSDGGFYAYEVPPGNYQLFIEQQQLTILKAVADPDTLLFEIKAIPEGDFIEGLNFLLQPEDLKPPAKKPESLNSIITALKSTPEMNRYEQELSDKVDRTLRLIILAQTEFYKRDFDRAFKYVDESLNLYETAQGYALKGSLHYLRGNKIEAQQNWEKAMHFNPSIFIPDIEMLDQIINKEILD